MSIKQQFRCHFSKETVNDILKSYYKAEGVKYGEISYNTNDLKIKWNNLPRELF